MTETEKTLRKMWLLLVELGLEGYELDFDPNHLPDKPWAIIDLNCSEVEDVKVLFASETFAELDDWVKNQNLLPKRVDW